MRCEDALVTMLDIDVDALSATGTDAFAVHIRSCTRCAAVAATLRGETTRLAEAFAGPNSLASAVTHRARRNRVANYVVSPATALAASVMLWIMFRMAQEPQISPQPLEQVPAAAPAPAPAPAPVDAPRITRVLKPAPRIAPALVRLPSPPPTLPVAYEAVAAVAAVREVEIVAPDLQIDPEPGTRATVMRGRNPNVTVVWLTK